MIDAGFSAKETASRLNRLDPAPAPLAGVLITHEHTDHVAGCRVFCSRMGIPAILPLRTAEFLQTKNQIPENHLRFEPGSCFELGSFVVESFRVPHDAVDPVGYVIRCGELSVGVATDMGQLDSEGEKQLNGCDALLIESNYDCGMLRDCDRPLRTKRRIAGRHGHMDNCDTCNALEKLLSSRTRLLMLCHVSRDCNDYQMVESLFRQRLINMGREDIHLAVARQDEITGPFHLGTEGIL